MSARKASEDHVANPAEWLSFDDLLDQYRARPVTGDRGRDGRLAIVEKASDDPAFDQNILAFVAKQLVQPVAVRGAARSRGGLPNLP